ncbi:hypothetical protein Patl1_18560 [Pistacia atlantica]|uniref:Uncharacterized protein n=1 Tax=Pistacia atlantica TaxID=434234 RepID=A0ACC1C1X7_9ROSI|nr:hypothetical protein Patl1_18560 [Pistacia atlantica]
MSKLRGFKLGRKIVKVFKWMIRPRRKRSRYHLGDSRTRNYNAMSRLFSHLRRGAKKLCFGSSNSGYIQLVYVGESNDVTKRVLVPVMYFNHPLFGELLKEAKRVYGFNPPGGITIPCRISEFEKVQMRIPAWDHYRRRKQPPYWW